MVMTGIVQRCAGHWERYSPPKGGPDIRPPSPDTLSGSPAFSAAFTLMIVCRFVSCCRANADTDAPASRAACTSASLSSGQSILALDQEVAFEPGDRRHDVHRHFAGHAGQVGAAELQAVNPESPENASCRPATDGTGQAAFISYTCFSRVLTGENMESRCRQSNYSSPLQ